MAATSSSAMHLNASSRNLSTAESRSASKVAEVWDTVAGEPLDYSFKDLAARNHGQRDLLQTVPSLRRPPPPLQHQPASPPSNVLVVRPPQKRNASPRRASIVCVEALRLCNNQIAQLSGLPGVVTTLMRDVKALKWLDLSFNKLEHIDPCLGQLLSLSHLYLHSNALSHIHEVSNVASLEHLRTLTLHGNPVTDARDYKSVILAYLPKLKHLDFGGVTKTDRATAKRHGTGRPHKRSVD
ncbi:hypothetical protein RI367_005592 [Sorochytrium milnesiophthora]